MNLRELESYIVDNRIRSDAVSVGRGLPSETEKYCIVKEGKLWEVYYSERGSKGGLAQFLSEEEACNHLIRLLERDRSVKLP